MAIRYDILAAVAARFAGLGRGGEERAGGTFTGVTFWRYPIVVAYITAGNQHLEEGLEGYLQNCEAIRNEMFQPGLVGVSPLFDTRVNPEEVIRFAEALGSNYDVTGWVGLYQTNEQRKS